MMETVGLWKDRIRARILQPIDNRLWRFWKRDTNPYRIHNRIHVDAIPTYAPELDLETVRLRQPAIYEHVIHRYSEYAFEFTFPLLIEPRRSWLIPEPLRILKESFPMVNDPWDGMKPRPSTWRYFANRRVSMTLERAIVVSYGWQNYYHFFVDTLPQLALLDSLGVDRDIPVVVPQHFATTRYVQEFGQLSSFLEGRTFVVQRPGEYIRVVGATHVAKDVFFSPTLSRILDTIGLSTATGDAERIFLRRDPAGPRALSNDAAIAKIAEAHGYRVVDTATLNLREQIALFRGASAVVGIHGAGLTNIIFRRGEPLHLLEIVPANLGSTHYRSMCTQFGYSYARLTGGALDSARRFALDAGGFERALCELENSSSGVRLPASHA